MDNHRLHDDGEVPAGEFLSAESLPVIDTRLLSQSELLSLSLCSPLSSSSSTSASLAAYTGGDDDLTPNIDRSVFNESAGSRKQTFLRLRLARHPPPPRPPSPRRRFDESAVEENSQVVSLLRSLFSIDSFPRKRKGVEESFEEYEREDSEGQRLFPVPINFFSNSYQNLNLDSVQSVLVQVISESETKRKRGRPRKLRNPSDLTVDIVRTDEIEALPYSLASGTCGTPLAVEPSNDLSLERINGASGFFTDSNSNSFSTLQVKRKRGRPPKNRGSLDQVTVSRKSGDIEPLDLLNGDGAIVDLVAFTNGEDPFGEELRRRTIGLQTKAELLGFLAQLRGEWVNAGKKKRVVEASEFGGTLPRGWKLMLCVKQKAGNVWLACRRYMSPEGKQFASYNEVSAYLCPILEAQGKNQLYATQYGDKTTVPRVMFREALDHGGHADFPPEGPAMKQPRTSGDPAKRAFEHVKIPEHDLADPVRSIDPVDTHSAIMRDSTDRESDMVSSLGRDNLDVSNRDSMLIDFFSRDCDTVELSRKDSSNMTGLVALSDSEALYGEKLRKMSQGMATTEELIQFWNS